MSELISGKEAKLAWANGENIELCYKQYKEENTWFLLLSTDPLSTFDRDDFLFRLKPKTITINGIEVPAPFEPKDGDVFWHIFPTIDQGYGWCYEDGEGESMKQFGSWRTEEEVKQVVEALRSIFNAN